MTTDITELAQRMKTAAEEALSTGGISNYRKGQLAMQKFLSQASAENILALVEALEKAQAEISSANRVMAAQDSELSIRRQRIASLEESHAQVIQSRDHYKRMAEEGLKQLAESRTVTVKLPDLRQIVSGDRYVWSDGVFNYSQDVKSALTAAAIKWETE